MSLNYFKKTGEKLLVGTGITITICLGVGVNSSSAASPTFECEFNNEETQYPTTVVSTEAGEKDFIIWNSNFFEKSGYSNSVRCEQVTNRLNNLFANGDLLLTHGIMNKYPVICTTNEIGEQCIDLVYTLKPEIQNPDNVLKSILAFDVQEISPTNNSVDALYENSTRICPLYIGFDRHGEIIQSRACEPKQGKLNIFKLIFELFN